MPTNKIHWHYPMIGANRLLSFDGCDIASKRVNFATWHNTPIIGGFDVQGGSAIKLEQSLAVARPLELE